MQNIVTRVTQSFEIMEKQNKASAFCRMRDALTDDENSFARSIQLTFSHATAVRVKQRLHPWCD